MANSNSEKGLRRQTIRAYVSKPPAAASKEEVKGINGPPPVAEPLFELGTVYCTPAAMEAIHGSGEEPIDYLSSHVQGDWGHVFDEDREGNHQAIMTGERIISAYRTGNGVKIWVLTEEANLAGDRPETTILLPSEY